jgi:acyl-CoA synthetase (AMP-forming)/AMP-acid ligase II/1-acyl-sn-glycerol-3-phosphate acyltransferase/acyl carrier protein
MGWLIRNFVLLALRLRYSIRVTGREEVAARGRSGILFLPNHPALVDPIIVTASLHRLFRPRPLADAEQLRHPLIAWFTRKVNVLPLTDLRRNGPGAKDQVAAVVRQCAERLRAGDNILLYPSGHLYRSHLEDLRGNSAVEQILQMAPETRVVLVRTRGLWGSSFSFAFGKLPNLLPNLRRHIVTLLKNLIFFTPRRRVTIELWEPSDLPRTAGRAALNAFIERYYNENALPNLYVPYTIWEKGGVQERPAPDLGAVNAGPVEVPESTRKIVIEYLQKLCGETNLRDDQKLAQDLGLDSLARAELLVWLGQEFGFHTADVASLQTVGDVLRAARGEAGQDSHPLELAPVPPAWKARRRPAAAVLPSGDWLTDVFLAQAARDPLRAIVADQLTGVRTYRDLITAILAMKPLVAAMPGERIGILLPASVGATVAYLTAIFAGKTPVLLNWTTGTRNMAHAMQLTGVQRVLTVKTMLQRLESQGTDMTPVRDAAVYLEELRTKIGLFAKLAAAFRARFSWASLRHGRPSEYAAILLTSGSEALPKAVPLSHANLLANLRDIPAFFTLREDDSLIGFLPPFHSFGLTVTMLLPLLYGVRVVYHANPTEGWVLSNLIAAYEPSLVVGTPTFLSGIARVAREPLRTLRLAVTGAEKCPDRTYELLREKMPNAVVLEGYGVTECSPVVAANTHHDPRPGSIGRLLPSYEAAIVDVDTNEPVPDGQPGMLLVRGPAVFGGYLGDAAPPFVEHGGKQWYRTGDLVTRSPDGVLHFRGRLKRFIKLGGEMISLPAIESVLLAHYGREDDEGPPLAVEATPSEDHPEIVLFTTRDIERSDANRLIREAQLSGLHNISQVARVEAIPVLGTGKTDYRALRSLLVGGAAGTSAARDAAGPSAHNPVQ